MGAVENSNGVSIPTLGVTVVSLSLSFPTAVNKLALMSDSDATLGNTLFLVVEVDADFQSIRHLGQA